MNDPKANKIANPAKTRAAPKVASAGTISSSPERKMMIDSAATASANSAKRRDHTASREVGSSPNVGRRAIKPYPAQIRFNAAHSLASRKGVVDFAPAKALMLAMRAL